MCLSLITTSKMASKLQNTQFRRDLIRECNKEDDFLDDFEDCTDNEYTRPAKRAKRVKETDFQSLLVADVMREANSIRELLVKGDLKTATKSCLMSNVVGSSSDMFYGSKYENGKTSRVEPSLVNPPDESKPYFVGWIQWWEERTGKEASICAFKSCANPRVKRLVGGHVWAKDPELGLKTSRKVHFIVPICSNCNQKGKKDAPDWFEARAGSIFVPIQCVCNDCKDWKSHRSS